MIGKSAVWIFTAVLAVVGMTAGAWTIKTLDGKVYHHAHIYKIAADGIGVHCRDGVRFIKFSNLPENLKKALGYDANMAAQYPDIGAKMTIKTRDGKEYKNVTIIGVSPEQVDIEYTTPSGVDTVQGIKLPDLTDQLRRAFGYSPEKFKETERLSRERAKAVLEKAAEDAAYERYVDAIDKEASSRLEGQGQKVIVKIIEEDDRGAIGWATTNLSVGEGEELGKVCLVGVDMPPGAAWYGVMYPIGDETVSTDKDFGVPCYGSYDTAKGILMSQLADGWPESKNKPRPAIRKPVKKTGAQQPAAQLGM